MIALAFSLFPTVLSHGQHLDRNNSIGLAIAALLNTEDPLDHADARLGFSMAGAFEVGVALETLPVEIETYEGLEIDGQFYFRLFPFRQQSGVKNPMTRSVLFVSDWAGTPKIRSPPSTI